LKLNGTHQLLAYADDVNILGGSIHNLKQNAERSVAATSEIGLEVSAEKSKYMVMSRDQNAGRIQSVRIDNNISESVEEFKYLGTIFKKSKFYCGRNEEQIDLGKFLLLFGAGTFFLHVIIQKFKDQYI